MQQEDCFEDNVKKSYRPASEVGEMKNRGLDYSPRFRTGVDTRVAGGVVDNRVSGKEKRRRVHAWLGAQIRSETESLELESSQTSAQQSHRLPARDSTTFRTPNSRMAANKVETTVSAYSNSDGYHPLPSESKFLTGNSGIPTSQHVSPTLGISAYVEKYTTGKHSIPPGSEAFTDHYHATEVTDTAPSAQLYGVTHGAGKMSGDHKPYSNSGTINREYTSFTDGGGDNYCYVYDPAIAKAYTKKYPISPSINTPPPSDHQLQAGGDGRPKRFPGKENFTPYPIAHPASAVAGSDLCNTENAALVPGDHGYQQHPPSGSFAQDLYFPLPTKYEEYDMRPIKPLDAKTKKSLYGEVAQMERKPGEENQEKKHVFLRRSHTTAVPAPTSKHMTRSKPVTVPLRSKDKHSPAARPMTRILSNVENRRKSVHGNNASPHLAPSGLSPRRKRQQHHIADKLRKPVGVKMKKTGKPVDEPHSCNDEDCRESPHSESVHALKIPVDLKHVKAATKIQAVWKGYRTRKLDPKVVEIRQEVRARRAEQYISLLCHEVQSLRENLESENKMRDLQTEAIRYIWSQLRALQKQKCGHCDSSKPDSNNKRRRSPDSKQPRSQSKSPKRGKTRGNRKNSSPQNSPRGSPRGALSASPSRRPGKDSDSSALDFEVETESVESYVVQKKQADVSWKEVVDEDIFSGRKPESPRTTHSKNPQTPCQGDGTLMEDTDEGRGTLVTDGEGNAALSSAAEDTDCTGKVETKSSKRVVAENMQLKLTINTLQEQVAQLQEAMLTLSDRILSRSFNSNFHDAWDEGEDLRLVPDTQVSSLPISAPTSPPTKVDKKCLALPANAEPEEIVSARGEVPRISLKNVLTTLHSPLSEDELWAICEQACQNVKNRKSPSKYIALETTYLRKDGRVELADEPEKCEVDEMYLAPEVVDNKPFADVKASIFSLSVVLWSSADWEMSADQAPQLSQELESLLVVMSQDDVDQRAEVDDVIKICEDYHAKAGVNSLRVCSSVFAEAKEAWVLNSRGKSGNTKMTLEAMQEQDIKTKTTFRDKVVPDIKTYYLRSSLKPASERVLSPRRHAEPTPHEQLMESLTSSKPSLRRSPRPKVFSVRDMFQKDPELVQKLNILPGQRRKNQKAMRLVMRRQSPRDPAPVSGVPTAPTALRATVNDRPSGIQGQLSSVVLRWHPAKVFDKHGEEAEPEKIIGYRIYVNGHPKGMVAGTKSRALLEGLRFSTEYRVNVRAVSALGESEASNTVIAHITQSPPRRNRGQEGQSSDQMPRSEDKENYPSRSNEPPKAQPRKTAEGNAPQAKPRLGAIFPKQDAVDGAAVMTQQSGPAIGQGRTGLQNKSQDLNSGSPNQCNEKKDDIIDRVLKRYGIQQAAAIVPGYASGSTLSPVPVGYCPKSSASMGSNRASTQTSLLEKSSESSIVSGRSSTVSESLPSEINGMGGTEMHCVTQGEITPKSLELLTQLKKELLN